MNTNPIEEHGKLTLLGQHLLRAMHAALVRKGELLRMAEVTQQEYDRMRLDFDRLSKGTE